MVTEKEEQEKKGISCQQGLRGLLPEASWEHHRAARRERLLSWRSFFDAAIERIEEKPEEAAPEKRRRLIPGVFWSHRRAACREELLACRSFLDAIIEPLEGSSTAKAQRIEVK